MRFCEKKTHLPSYCPTSSNNSHHNRTQVTLRQLLRLSFTLDSSLALTQRPLGGDSLRLPSPRLIQQRLDVSPRRRPCRVKARGVHVHAHVQCMHMCLPCACTCRCEGVAGPLTCRSHASYANAPIACSASSMYPASHERPAISAYTAALKPGTTISSSLLRHVTYSSRPARPGHGSGQRKPISHGWRASRSISAGAATSVLLSGGPVAERDRAPCRRSFP